MYVISLEEMIERAFERLESERAAKAFIEEFGVGNGMRLCHEDLMKWIDNMYGRINHLQNLLTDIDDIGEFANEWSRTSTNVSNWYSALVEKFIYLYKPRGKLSLVDKIVQQAKR